MKIMKLFALLLISSLAFTACTDDDEIGLTDNGVYTVYAEILTEDWVDDPNDQSRISASFDIPEITDDVHDYGAVLVYISYDGGGTYEAIPQVYNNLSFSFFYSPGSLTIDAQTIDGTLVPYPADISVKIVTIAELFLKSHPNFDPTNPNLKFLGRFENRSRSIK